MDQAARLQFLFDRYLSGTCSPEEVEDLVALLHKEGADRYLDERLRALWERSGEEPGTYPVDWDRMLAAVRRSDDDLVQFQQYRDRQTLRRRWAGVAAAAAILIIGGGIGWMTRPRAPKTAVTAQVPAAAPAKTHTIHLPDGSTVVLNTSSKLNYPTAFTGRTREVYLSGEGYFDIRPVPGQPFLVHTGKLTTRVLGTTFDIRAYPGDGAIDITVTKGRVQVLNERKNLGTLSANQQIHFVPETEAARQQTVDIQPIVAWRPREIFYDNITMDSAARALEQRFGVSVAFVNPNIKACRVTATFSPDDGLEDFLAVLCGVTQSTYVVRGRSVSLDGKGCP
jgi:transmembrane sensor